MPTIRRGEVWWVSFDRSRGGQIRKRRPAVVLSNDVANAALNRVVVVPVTSQAAKLYPGEARITIEGRPAKAMADQIATAAKERLGSRLGILTPADLEAVERAILFHLSLDRKSVARSP